MHDIHITFRVSSEFTGEQVLHDLQRAIEAKDSVSLSRLNMIVFEITLDAEETR
jgi:hypothetical protein